MIISWFKIYNLDDFEESGLVSKNLELPLLGLGTKQIMLTKGNSVGVLVDGVFLLLNLNDKNPFYFDERLAYVDENQDIWLGVVRES